MFATRSIYRLFAPLSSIVLALAVVLLLAAPAKAQLRDDPDFLAISAGAFDVDDDETTFEGRIEYRSDKHFWIFKPLVGAMGTGQGSAYLYGGVVIDLYWGRRIVTSFSFAPGAYIEGGGKDLGHVLEFRSQAEIGYRFDNRSRLALAFSHMSNASIGTDNPGTENLVLTYAIPLDGLWD